MGLFFFRIGSMYLFFPSVNISSKKDMILFNIEEQTNKQISQNKKPPALNNLKQTNKSSFVMVWLRHCFSEGDSQNYSPR